MEFLKNGFQNTNRENTNSADDDNTAVKNEEKDEKIDSAVSQLSDGKEEICVPDQRSQMM